MLSSRIRKIVLSAVLVFFVAFVFAGSWRSWQVTLKNHQETSTNKQKNAEASQESAGTPNAAIGQETGENQKLTDAQKREATQREQELLIQRDIAKFNHQLVIATWILGIIGFGTGIVLYFTLCHARESSERQLRAYVHIEDIVMSEMNSGYDAIIQVIIRNYGQTPARWITNTYQCLPMVRPTEPGFTLNAQQTAELGDLAPTQKTYSTFPYPYALWQSIKTDISTKTTTFYVFGRIDYRDVFERPRWSEYRFYLKIGATGIPDEESLVVDSRAGNRTT
jgi:hypothetical protein